ncbi:MAG: type II toxin-antitoxin system prevent-host-death family antitoxin [Bifidobacteriaceae bacterium]|nr:type II toxin-antitoxin system prevent-host-death family antitoxin [Bifidobacteriaceae bacterium]
MVNILEARSTLSQLVRAVESGSEREVVISRNGVPAARLVPVASAASAQRIGVAKGLFEVPESINDSDEEIATLFFGESSRPDK